MSKILFLDIENSPNLAYVWGKYQQDVISFEYETQLISLAYKWQGKKRPNAITTMDEKQILKELYPLLCEADVIVGHNVDRFDLRKINARLLAEGYRPPSPYKTVDTYKVAKRHFMFNSNRLGDICKYLGLEQKIETGGFDLWLRCMAGEKKATKEMAKYNMQDVVITEQLYNKLLPWIPNHPNLNILDNKTDGCPNCGSLSLQRRGVSGKFQRWQCQDCGKWSRSRLAEKGSKPNVV